MMAKIVVIVGSVRSERNGIKVAKWVVKNLEDKGHLVSLVDPMQIRSTPYWIKCIKK